MSISHNCLQNIQGYPAVINWLWYLFYTCRSGFSNISALSLGPPSSPTKPSKTVTQNQLLAVAPQSLIRAKPVSAQDNCEAVVRVSFFGVRIFTTQHNRPGEGRVQRWSLCEVMTRCLRITRNSECYVLNTIKDKRLVKVAKWLFYSWIIKLFTAWLHAAAM